jgi:hypothetical protein
MMCKESVMMDLVQVHVLIRYLAERTEKDNEKYYKGQPQCRLKFEQHGTFGIRNRNTIVCPK